MIFSLLLINRHIPGQEARNYQYITANRCGAKCENPARIRVLVQNWIDSGALQAYLENALRAGGNDGTQIIADYIFDICNNSVL